MNALITSYTRHPYILIISRRFKFSGCYVSGLLGYLRRSLPILWNLQGCKHTRTQVYESISSTVGILTLVTEPLIEPDIENAKRVRWPIGIYLTC